MPSVYFAPMEGLTDSVYRRVHHECFSGVEAYYTPFISPTKHLVLTNREKKNVLPEYNADTPCIPQVLTRDEAHFRWAAEMMAEFGYQEINLNAGCPSGTVTAKGKGAGILKDIKELDYFLEDIFLHSPLPISVKTRIGFDSPEEWHELIKVYSSYPISRLIVHPRTCRERYDPGTIHMECWQEACETFKGELIFNGDLFSKEQVNQLLSASPNAGGIMLGRGLVANPALAREVNGGEKLKKEELIAFHDRLSEELLTLYQPDIAFMKLRVVMKHIACCFGDAGKIEKKIRKSRNLNELLDVDKMLFECCNLKENPVFIPDEIRKQYSTTMDAE